MIGVSLALAFLKSRRPPAPPPQDNGEVPANAVMYGDEPLLFENGEVITYGD